MHVCVFPQRFASSECISNETCSCHHTQSSCPPSRKSPFLAFGRSCALKARRASFSRRAGEHTPSLASRQCRHADVSAWSSSQKAAVSSSTRRVFPLQPRQAAHTHLSWLPLLELDNDLGFPGKFFARTREWLRQQPEFRYSSVTRPAYICPRHHTFCSNAYVSLGTPRGSLVLGFLPRVELAGNGRYPFCGAARGHVEVDAIPGIEASEVRPHRAR